MGDRNCFCDKSRVNLFELTAFYSLGLLCPHTGPWIIHQTTCSRTVDAIWCGPRMYCGSNILLSSSVAYPMTYHPSGMSILINSLLIPVLLENSYPGFKSKLKQLTIFLRFIKLEKALQVPCLNG